jgi:hypothetical protein
MAFLQVLIDPEGDVLLWHAPQYSLYGFASEMSVVFVFIAKFGRNGRRGRYSAAGGPSEKAAGGGC